MRYAPRDLFKTQFYSKPAQAFLTLDKTWMGGPGHKI